jgi:ribonuclease D
MAPDTLQPPIWVATPSSLQQAGEVLGRELRLAVDTESNSLHAYRERVCLIQFSTTQTDYLIDPLALDDLSPLAPLFANPRIEKVFHAVEYDLIGLRRDFKIVVNNVFDTMQAARILGYKQVGLDGVLALKLGVKIDKHYQKADWARRPLPSNQLNYARLDTHFLLKLRDILYAELNDRGRWALASEEFLRLSHGNGYNKTEIPIWQRICGAQVYSDRQLVILQALCAWRDRQAEHMNRPPFKVIDDQRLAAIAQAVPRTPDELKDLGLTSKQIAMYGDEFLELVAKSAHTNPARRLRMPRPTPAFLDRLEVLSDWRKRTAGKMGVESDIVLPKSFMHAIAEGNPHTLRELAAYLPESPWRLGTFGQELLQVLAGPPKPQRGGSDLHSS